MKRKDIRGSASQEKVTTYFRIHMQWQLGVPVTLKQHRSGFPAVTVDCGDDHIITDILSLEQWWKTLSPEMMQRLV